MMIIPVILCGGAGTRLWPASRENYPKQLLKLAGDLSLLQQTASRAARISGAEPSSVVTVTLEKLQSDVRAQLEELNPSFTNHIICEPATRNTAAAIAYAATYIKKEFGSEAVLWVLPSDHHIGDEGALKRALEESIPHAGKNLVTFGINPSHAETSYGYIGFGENIAGALSNVKNFVEKPDVKTAQGFCDSGSYLWNSGMFLFSVETVLREFELHAPHILNGLHSYETLPAEPLDRAILEKSNCVAVIPCNPGWSDIGSWERLWEVRDKDTNGNVIDGDVAFHDTKNCLIHVKDHIVACAGLENIVIVQSGDAILIADRTKPESLKKMVAELNRAKAA
jgi:mannose-1-phosphate guanylyltransferase